MVFNGGNTVAVNFVVHQFCKILQEFHFADEYFLKILRELDFKVLGKNRENREIFFQRKFLSSMHILIDF